jgi:hypothetical protein
MLWSQCHKGYPKIVSGRVVNTEIFLVDALNETIAPTPTYPVALTFFDAFAPIDII